MATKRRYRPFRLFLLVGSVVFCDGEKVILKLNDTGKFVQGHRILKTNYKLSYNIYNITVYFIV
jgi:hypothetical protein